MAADLLGVRTPARWPREQPSPLPPDHDAGSGAAVLTCGRRKLRGIQVSSQTAERAYDNRSVSQTAGPSVIHERG